MTDETMKRWIFGALVAVAACRTQTVEGGWNDEGPTPNAASITAKCAAPETTPLAATDVPTFEGLVAGRWYRCADAQPAIGYAPGAIELTSHLAWSVLGPNSSGAYVPDVDAGAGQASLFKVIAECCPDSYAVSLDGGTGYDIVSFQSSPTRMTWSYDDGGARILGVEYVQ
jgi:hypothetical protein